ncbi:GNAT acetyltransferase-like protein [Thermosporothrix hazakensis]|jgi:hypothetical protein|uniref:GNAT acetyltransferase-like protein n=1 Tax=Thermosporothrix hazakensis TaxID=644383 RepID=A0A326U7X9_THEHA|nr:GNAT family N-acetyltransferase [Thermosporothrix hazakensis]PZW22442.1 GNAT acetyltransferase-like protein [Thermosporothrix hazakensis]GCE45500.1 hypothetical protein KTH_03690 [Thermosporothrix hazakensis]
MKLSQEREWLRSHIEAVWSLRIPPLERDQVEILYAKRLPPWQLFYAQLLDTATVIEVWHPDIAEEAREQLREQAHEALATSHPMPAVLTREVACTQQAAPQLDLATARSLARVLDEEDRALLHAFEPGSVEYYLEAHRQPLIGVIVDGRLLSVAHSSRRTETACELGIETLPLARRKGYALAATVLWSALVAQEGLLPLYSAMLENLPSRRLAAAAGFREFMHAVLIQKGR